MYEKVVEVDGDDVEADGELQLVVYEPDPDDEPELDAPNRSTRGTGCWPTGSVEPSSGTVAPGSWSAGWWPPSSDCRNGDKLSSFGDSVDRLNHRIFPVVVVTRNFSIVMMRLLLVGEVNKL